MDPPIIGEASFSAANPGAYSLAEIWPFPIGGLGLRMGSLGTGFGGDVSLEESTVTEQSNSMGNGGRKRGSEAAARQLLSTCSGKDLNNFNGKRTKLSGSRDENGGSKSEVGANSETENKPAEPSTKPSESPKQDYIHVRARRGQATDSHSLAERARREKISERMKILQDLVPGCNKVIGKALVLDEIINYVQALQRQVEFLSMKLEAINSRMVSPIEGFSSKDLGGATFDAAGILFGSQAGREYMQASQPEWLHMQLGNTFDRPT